MHALTRREEEQVAGERDESVVLRGLGWDDYERLLAARGESAVPRMTYLDGTLELISPGIPHEGDKKRLARLVEAYADELDLELNGFGSWTIRDRERRAGLEPDECYTLDDPTPDARPHIAIEVVKSGSGLGKLEVYHRLGVREVWLWKRGRLLLFEHHSEGYRPLERSAVIPQLDLELIVRCMPIPSQRDAVKTLREILRGRR